VAVGDAVPELKAAADLVTEAKGGAGVAELVQAMLADDFSPVSRRALSLGDATS
jgi:3-deoxy-D-manno-octulosonate 8-phosphate phosphatase KdsC-like HAD superfamily phosphatase